MVLEFLLVNKSCHFFVFVFFYLELKPAKMMQCFHFMVEPAKNLTAKIKVSSVCLMCKPVFLGGKFGTSVDS